MGAFMPQARADVYLGREGGLEGSATVDNSTTYAAPQANSWTKDNATVTIADNDTSPATWQNTAFTSQIGTFTAEFDAIPGQANMDGVIGLSLGAADAYTDLAAIVRFNNTGTIDVRNGTTYGAAATVSYNTGVSTGTSYHFRMIVNVTAHTYSVYVKPQGTATETALATNYAFRTEQSGVTALNNSGQFAGIGSQQVQDLTITPTVSPLSARRSTA